MSDILRRFDLHLAMTRLPRRFSRSRRDGIGDLLAVSSAQSEPDRAASTFAMHSKGLEMPGYDVRSKTLS